MSYTILYTRNKQVANHLDGLEYFSVGQSRAL